MMLSQRSTGKASMGATCWMPALLTSTSTAPKSRSVRATSSAICAASDTSAEWCSTRVPWAEIRLRAASTSPKPLSITSAPASASLHAIPRPMPLVEPVISAVLPFNIMSGSDDQKRRSVLRSVPRLAVLQHSGCRTGCRIERRYTAAAGAGSGHEGVRVRQS